MKIHESFKILIGDKIVVVIHDGLKKFEDQHGGVKEVHDYIDGRISGHDETSGLVPYNSFECQFRWSVIEEASGRDFFNISNGLDDAFELIDNRDQK